MVRKRYTSPAALLTDVIGMLEAEEPRRHRPALLALLTHGPLQSPAAARERSPVALPEYEVATIRAELLRLLRDVVRSQVTGRLAEPMHFDGPLAVTFGPADGGRVACHVDGPTRTVIAWQLLMLLDAIGLPQVHRCPAPSTARGAPPGTTCGRLFVKTFRRAYCSARCQKRHYMRVRRQQDHEHQARQARRRRQRGA